MNEMNVTFLAGSGAIADQRDDSHASFDACFLKEQNIPVFLQFERHSSSGYFVDISSLKFIPVAGTKIVLGDTPKAPGRYHFQPLLENNPLLSSQTLMDKDVEFIPSDLVTITLNDGEPWQSTFLSYIHGGDALWIVSAFKPPSTDVLVPPSAPARRTDMFQIPRKPVPVRQVKPRYTWRQRTAARLRKFIRMGRL